MEGCEGCDLIAEELGRGDDGFDEVAQASDRSWRRTDCNFLMASSSR